MSKMSIMSDPSWAEDLAIVKLNKATFALRGAEDLPMTKNQLNKLLTKVLNYPAEEIAFMYSDFEEKTHHRVAFFGAIDGRFLYTK
jgi:hypothetical protein